MADLTFKDTSMPVQIVGADANGVEGVPVGSDASGNLKVVNGNAPGAAAVNIQDGGNSITVDAPQLPTTLGQKTSANSMAVVLSSDQTSIPVTIASSIEIEIKNDAGSPLAISAASLPLPTGAAAETTLSALNAKAPTLGQKSMTGSVPIAISSDQTNIPVSDILVSGGLQSALAVGTTAVEVKVGASKLINRKLVTIMPQDDMFWGWTSGVTTSTGTPIFKNQLVTFEVNAAVTIYLIASAAAKSARITECA